MQRRERKRDSVQQQYIVTVLSPPGFYRKSIIVSILFQIMKIEQACFLYYYIPFPPSSLNLAVHFEQTSCKQIDWHC